MTEDHPSHPAKSSASHYFITGFPDFLAQGMLKQILSVSPEARITLLIPPDVLPQAKPRLESLQGQRLEVLTGDIIDMHLGLSGDEYIRMCASVTDISLSLSSRQSGAIAGIHSDLHNVDPGFAASRRPGMTSFGGHFFAQ